MPTTIYHNPECGTSRNTLALLRHAGAEPRVIEYLLTPPSRDELSELIRRMGLRVRDAIRERGTPYRDLGLADPGLSDDHLLDAMVTHPILINRPIVTTPLGARLCRPSEIALELLPGVPAGGICKEEGAPFLVDREIAGQRPGILLSDEFGGRRREAASESFSAYSFRSLEGDVVARGGLVRLGADVLLTQMSVTAVQDGDSVALNATLLLLRRAFDRGARDAYALPSDAVDLWTLGFEAHSRDRVPARVLAEPTIAVTEETVLHRRITP